MATKKKGDGDEPVNIGDGVVIRATEKAILVQFYDGDGGDIWFPKACLCDGNQVLEEGDSGDIVVQKWIARDKGLVE